MTLALPVVETPLPSGLRGDRAVAWIAGRQHGVVARRQLLACGLSGAAIEHRVGRGRLHRVHRGVYAVGHDALDFRARALGAVLALGPGAVLSHHSAARLSELLPAGTGDAVGAAVIDVTVFGGRNVRARPGIRPHRSTALDARDLRWVGAIPVTAPARTVLDVAGCDGLRMAERMLAECLRGRHATEAEVRALLVRSPGRAGLGLLDRLVRDGPAFDRSVAERLLLELVRRSGLPEPRTNARIASYEVDGVWDDLRVVVEFDSVRFHQDRAAFRRDRRKSARLQAAGFDVVPVIWEDLTGTPELVVATLASVQAVARERLRRAA